MDDSPATRPRRVTTLVYARRAGRVALLRRRKAPNLGLWSPPGGKVERDESPLESALRELREETGLEARAPRLRAVVTERDVAAGEDWLMFVFLVEADGLLGGDGREGAAEWVPLERISELPTPPADRHILAAVLDEAPGTAFLHVEMESGAIRSLRLERG